MAVFYLIRHGKTDYSERNAKIYRGFGVNLAPLSALGIAQIERAARDKRLAGARLILSSPYTRAVQTAAILSRALDVDIAIETDLHEWLANKNYAQPDDGEMEKNYAEFVRHGGVCPPGGDVDWEDVRAMQKRIVPVLQKYSRFEKVAVACHGLFVQALCGGYFPDYGEIVEFTL